MKTKDYEFFEGWADATSGHINGIKYEEPNLQLSKNEEKKLKQATKAIDNMIQPRVRNVQGNNKEDFVFSNATKIAIKRHFRVIKNIVKKNRAFSSKFRTHIKWMTNRIDIKY